jgi:2-succinyl-5-enolpyruvyl-6-hydroxy-3-cyclohexene-1-carboxylate synthase
LNVAVIGDLTALYDLNAPWIVPQLDPSIEFQIYIVNNGGGKIFARVPSLRALPEETRQRLIENTHSLSFEHWAAMWNLPYNNRDSGRAVIELMPDADATARVWQRFDELWA